MNIILTKDIDHLGSAGDIVKVKDGYARNYLVPQGFAIPANEKNIKQTDFHRRMIQKKINQEIADAGVLAEKLASVDISISKKVGEEGKLFGSVTTREIAEELKNKGFDIDHRSILMDAPIKKSGVYELDIKLFREVRGKIKVWVVALDGEIPQMTEAPQEEPEETPEAPVEEIEDNPSEETDA